MSYRHYHRKVYDQRVADLLVAIHVVLGILETLVPMPSVLVLIDLA